MTVVIAMPTTGAAVAQHVLPRTNAVVQSGDKTYFIYQSQVRLGSVYADVDGSRILESRTFDSNEEAQQWISRDSHHRVAR